MKKITIASVLLIGAIVAWYYLRWARIMITNVDKEARVFDYKMETANNTVTGTKSFDPTHTSQVKGNEGFFIESVDNGFILHIDSLSGWTKASKFLNTSML